MMIAMIDQDHAFGVSTKKFYISFKNYLLILSSSYTDMTNWKESTSVT